MREVKFVNGEYYHVFNRGVDKRSVFLDEDDFYRFYYCLFLFNDKNYRHPGKKHNFDVETELRISTSGDTPNYKPLTKILSFCLLSNHFHLMLQQVVDEGISTFLYRLGKGYTRYFNLRHERSGRLFESTFKATHVERDAYLWHLPRYIHLNALDRSHPDWREGTIKEWDHATQALDTYPWSSHDVYSYRVQRLPVVDIDAVSKMFSSPQSYLSFLREWAGRKSMPSYLETEKTRS